MSNRPGVTLPKAIIKLNNRVWEVVGYVGGGAADEGRLVLADIRDEDDQQEFAYKFVEVEAELLVAAPRPISEATPPSTEGLIEAARLARGAQPTEVEV